MRKLTRVIVRKFWGACAFLLISLAVFVVIGRELSPKLNAYKDELSSYLSEQLAVEVRIQRMGADWRGLSPELSLEQVELINPQGQTVLSMGKALLKLNLLRSLINGNFALDTLEASKVEMDLTQNDKGVWGFHGLPWKTTAEENIDIDDPLDLFLLIGKVELMDVQFSLNYRDGDQNQLNFPVLAFTNSDGFHRLNSSIVVGDNREAASLILEFRGDPRATDNFSAKGYTQFKAVDVHKVVAALPAQWQSEKPLWKNSVASVESWFDIFAGGEVLFRGRLGIEDSNPSALADDESGIQIPKTVGANFTGRLTAKGFWSVSLRDTIIDWESFQAPPLDVELSSNLYNVSPQNPSLQIRTGRVDISRWVQTLQQTGLVQGELQEALQSLNPRGVLTNAKLLIDPSTTTPNIEFSANFDAFQIDSWRGTPIVSGIAGYARLVGPLNQRVLGEIKIDSKAPLSLQFPTLYNQAMAFNSLTGQVNWQVDTDSAIIKINSSLLSATSSEGTARGYFDLYVPLRKEPGHEQLILQLGMSDTPVKHYRKYIPSRLPRDLLEWLESSMGENGNIDAGGLIYRGGLTPAGREHAEFQLYADVASADIRYHPDWPALTQASGELWMDGLQVHANVHSGKVFNGELEKLTFDIFGDTKQDQRILKINGEVRSDAVDGLALLQSDVFLPVIDHKLDNWSMQGPITTKLQLIIPLQGNSVEHQQQVDVTLAGVDLAMTGRNAEIKDIHGVIHYDQDNFLQAESLQGQFLGKAIFADIVNDQSNNQVKVTLRGHNNIEAISQWAELDFLKFVQGDSQFNVDLLVPVKGSDQVAEVRVSSNLQGITIDLPGVLGKTVAEEQRHFQFSAPLGRDNTYSQMHYGDLLYGVFHQSGRALRRAVLSTNPNPELPQSNRLLVHGNLAELNLDAWRETYATYFASAKGNSTANSLPIQADLQIQAFTLGDFVIDNLDLNANVRDHILSMQLASETIAGDVTVYDQSTQPILVDLQHLRLPRNKQTPPSWTDVFFPPSRPGDNLRNLDPSTVPAMDFKAAQVLLGDQSLGAWSFNARPLPSGLTINNLKGEFPEGRVGGLRDEEGARLNWLNTESGTQTRIEGKFYSNDLASVLEKWNQPQMLQSEDANFDFSLRWPGAPTSISTTELQGEVALKLAQGSFYRSGDQSAGGALLQLVSIFNFDTWVRRLRLDFSDLGRRGLSFDQVEGLLRFETGQVYLDKPIVVETQSGEFQLTGVVDLSNNQLDTKLTATLPMGGNLTFLTALAAGLPAAAGVWVVSKIFDEQIDKVSTLSYSIEGSIQNPNIEFDRLFDDKPESAQTKP
jgi:uncharacterized protein (TIGR02099 family)